MSGLLLIDGFDVATLGVVVESADRWRDIPRHGRTTTPRTGGIGVLSMGATPSVEARTLEIIATQAAADASALIAALDQLKRRLSRPSVQIRLPDMPERFFTAELERLTVDPIAPAFTQRAHRLRIALLCRDPRAYALSETQVSFTSATETPLGSAPVSPVIRITNPDSPVVIYRDSAGVERGRMELSTDSGSWVEVDSARGTITTSGGANVPGDLVGGDFITLDPADGSADGGEFPTLQVSGGSGRATYRRAWW